MMASGKTNLTVILRQYDAFPDGFEFYVRLYLDGQLLSEKTIINTDSSTVIFADIAKKTYTIEVTGSIGYSVAEEVTVTGPTSVSIEAKSGLCDVGALCKNNIPFYTTEFILIAAVWSDGEFVDFSIGFRLGPDGESKYVPVGYMLAGSELVIKVGDRLYENRYTVPSDEESYVFECTYQYD